MLNLNLRTCVSISRSLFIMADISVIGAHLAHVFNGTGYFYCLFISLKKTVSRWDQEPKASATALLPCTATVNHMFYSIHDVPQCDYSGLRSLHNEMKLFSNVHVIISLCLREVQLMLHSVCVTVSVCRSLECVCQNYFSGKYTDLLQPQLPLLTVFCQPLIRLRCIMS